MKLLELEHHFETEVAELHEEYLAVILQIREPQEQWEVGYNGEAGRAKRKGGTVTQSMAEQSTLYSRTGSMIPSKHNCEAAALGTSSVVQEA